MLLGMRWCGSFYWGTVLWGTFVSFVPLAGNAHMVPCMIALLYRGLTVSMVWHWTVCCALRKICDILSEVLINRVRENRIRSRNTLIKLSALLNLIQTSAIGFHDSYPWSISWLHCAAGHWLVHAADVAQVSVIVCIFIVRNIHSLAIISVTSTIWCRRKIKQSVHFSKQINFLQ